MNIDGLSEATIEKFIAKRIIQKMGDLFRLSQHKQEIVSMEGFGEKSYEHLIAAANAARQTTPAHFLYALGIPNIGLSNAKMICQYYHQDFSRVRHASIEELIKVDGIGEMIANSLVTYMNVTQNQDMIEDLLQEISWKEIEDLPSATLAGMQFVITGSLQYYENRSILKERIEALGGKVTGSVTGKTNYLINNDVNSQSGKNKKAKELGIEIINEDLLRTRFPDLL
jgi:DNA ligase (NAD+)